MPLARHFLGQGAQHHVPLFVPCTALFNTAARRARLVVPASQRKQDTTEAPVSTTKRDSQASSGATQTSGRSSNGAHDVDGRRERNSTVNQEGSASVAPASGSSSGSSKEPDDQGGDLQIGLDPFTRELLAAGITGTGAAGLALLAGVDLSQQFHLDATAVITGAEYSLPVLWVLLALCIPKWGSMKLEGYELMRLQQNYYFTNQVFRLYWVDTETDDDDDDDTTSSSNSSQRLTNSSSKSGSGGSSSSGQSSASASASTSGSSMNSRSDGGGAGGGAGAGDGGARRSSVGIKAKVKRQLKLESQASWTTFSSALALMQAYVLQPWNPPAPTSLAVLTLAGRTLSQLANEYWIRGALYGALCGWATQAVHGAGTDSVLFFGRVLGAADTGRWIGGAALMMLVLPLAWNDTRKMQNFVRASVVGPVRDAALFCTGDGINEPAYCDPRGFALQTARLKANKAHVADVVTQTRGWLTGASVGSGSSLDSMDSIGSVDSIDQEQNGRDGNSSPSTSVTASTSSSSSSVSSTSRTSSSQRVSPFPSPSSSTLSSSATPANGSNEGSNGSAAGGAGAGSGNGMVTVGSTSEAFDVEDEDMGVLLKVETAQDNIALAVWGYFNLASVVAINASYFVTGNLAASFVASWLIKTLPLLAVQVASQMRVVREEAAAAAGKGGPKN